MFRENGQTFPRSSGRPRLLMKSTSLFAIGLAASVLLSAQLNLKAATEGGMKFDGNWSVTLDAKVYKNPNGSTAQPFVRRFPATVKNSVFHGEIGTRGKPEWLELNGKIEVDGTADLRADLITGAGKWNFTQGRKAPPGEGTRYSYQVVARFDGQRGTGHSTDGRTRIYSFVKD
jgi:hypothetical protein